MNPDELREELRKQQNWLEDLIMRSKKQSEDLADLRAELQQLKDDIAERDV